MKNNYLKAVSQWLFFLFLFTCSFDLILNLELGGFHFRIGMLFLGFSEVLGFVYCVLKKEILVPQGGAILLILLILNGLFCFNSPSLSSALGYELWFIMLAGGLFLACNLFENEQEKRMLSRAFLFQFVVMALLGYFQFFMGMFGKSFYTRQWSKPFLPRINGFCYESSYYVSYILIGWVFVAYLFEKNDESIASKKKILLAFSLISGVIVFSAARMGWLMITLWCVWRLVYAFLKSKKDLKNIVLMISILLLFLLVIVTLTNTDGSVIENMANELGLKNVNLIESEAHATNHADKNFAERHLQGFFKSGTVVNRLIAIGLVIGVFLKSPFIGYSLGGVASAVAVNYPDVLERIDTTYICITAELLAAFGIAGFLIVAVYFFVLSKSVASAYKKCNNAVLLGWFWAFIWEIGILQFNQNILRLYLWALLAVMCVFIPNKKYELSAGEYRKNKNEK